jgi:hypothetical protein
MILIENRSGFCYRRDLQLVIKRYQAREFWPKTFQFVGQGNDDVDISALFSTSAYWRIHENKYWGVGVCIFLPVGARK